MPGEAPFLLTNPGHGGTLAAARCLGQHGVPITVAGSELLSPTRWSRFVARRVSCPPVHDTERFVAWLMEFGEREPGHVLYPTCDDLAWIVARHAGELGKRYRLYQPAAGAVLSLLDKKALHALCAELAIPTLPTAFPASARDVAGAARAVAFPLLLKPRTQIQLLSHGKGILVEAPERLDRALAEFLRYHAYRPAMSAVIPGVERPMLQAYRAGAATNIYSLAGFIDRDTGAIAVRASHKIRQRPRRLGVGLCFEERPVRAELVEGLARLCRAVGYFGVFEAEYVPDGDGHRLIDFNPRFYGQMGFEVARALPMAYLAWLGAVGRGARLAEELARAQAWQSSRSWAYCDGFFLDLMLSAQRLSGRTPRAEAERWRAWRRQHRRDSTLVDAVRWPGDAAPGVAAAVRELVRAVRHPREFLRRTILDDGP
jgi:predicted ATP-grasp superfamily ATP-dependent carboligase